METRAFKVGGHRFHVVLEEPWTTLRYTEPVLQRIRRCAEGASVPSGDDFEAEPLLPTRAGDAVPARTLIKSRSEWPADRTPYSLDLSQYEPFATEPGDDPLFTLTIRAEIPPALAEVREQNGWELLMKVDDTAPYYSIYRFGDLTVFDFSLRENGIDGTLCMDMRTATGSFYSHRIRQAAFHLGTALMMMFTCFSAQRQTLLMHASVIRHEGKANLFLGRSGTGKSTHSRLWLEHIPGCDLVNDDNPVLRFLPDPADGRMRLMVFGSPWSGKTPCYRNLSVPVRAVVRLDQAPENAIRRLTGLEAYASVLASCSAIRWSRPVMDAISASVEKIALETPCWHLDCRADQEAAQACARAVEA